MRSSENVSYIFPYGEQHNYSVFPASDIPLLVKDTPGIYAWYLRVRNSPDPITTMNSVSEVFASKRLRVHLKGNLNDSYNGEVKREPSFTGQPDSYHETLLAASVIFAPPVYIGISVVLKQRLSKHLTILESVLGRPGVFNPEDFTDDNSELDSDAESNSFGERMGRLLRMRSLDINSLFVKVIYSEGVTKAELVKTETFVNRTFVPMCGKR